MAPPEVDADLSDELRGAELVETGDGRKVYAGQLEQRSTNIELDVSVFALAAPLRLQTLRIATTAPASHQFS